MKRILTRLLFIVAAMTLSVIILHRITNILLIKGREHSYYSSPAQANSFYGLRKNSTDALIIGSSHAFYNLCPQELYDRYNIRSFNLGTPGQNVVCSYYWLKEALKYQHPQIVVLETFYFFNDTADIWNEGAHRKAVNYMRWSPIKLQAIYDICKVTPELSIASFLLPGARFHDRWKELSMEDFSTQYYRRHTEMKGYLPVFLTAEGEGYQPFREDHSVQRAEMNDVEIDYVKRIVDLCNNEGIQVLFLTTPTQDWNVQRHETVLDYSNELNVPYYDMNLQDQFDQLYGFDYYADGIDASGHANIVGGQKLTDYLGDILYYQLSIRGQEDVQWDSTSEYYQKLIKEFRLKSITDIQEYFAALNDDDYTILVSVRDDASAGMSDNIRQIIEAMGLPELSELDFQQSYIGVWNGGLDSYEISGDSEIHYANSLENGTVVYEISSAGFQCGDNSRIIIHDINGYKDYSRNRRGLNIVVYDAYDMAVIDSVVFDTDKPEMSASR